MRNCRHCELKLSTGWPTQAQTTKPKDTLEMCKQHLNALSVMARSLECFGLGERPRHVTGLLVDAALDSAQRHLWTALRLEDAAAAIARLSSVVCCLPIVKQLARRGATFAGPTNVAVLLLVEAEVFPTGAPVLALRLVDHWDMRRYLRHVHEPVQVGSGAVGGVARAPFRVDVE